MRKVMPDEDLERILAPRIEEERRQKAQKKARDQLNYERCQERASRLYEHEYHKAARQSHCSKYLPFLFIVLVVLLLILISTYCPEFEDFILQFHGTSI
mgnify:CR=1 FL=1